MKTGHTHERVGGETSMRDDELSYRLTYREVHRQEEDRMKKTLLIVALCGAAAFTGQMLAGRFAPAVHAHVPEKCPVPLAYGSVKAATGSALIFEDASGTIRFVTVGARCGAVVVIERQ